MGERENGKKCVAAGQRQLHSGTHVTLDPEMKGLNPTCRSRRSLALGERENGKNGELAGQRQFHSSTTCNS